MSKKWLDQRVKPRHPWFHGYLGCRWCANARLIDWDFDYYRVAKWLGHESVDRLKNDYEQDARLQAELHGRGWLERAFKSPKSKRTPSEGGLDEVPS